MIALTLAMMVALFVGAPTAMWLRHRDLARRRWLPRVAGTAHIGDGTYRGADVPRMVADGPPRELHVTAMLCWILGTMFVPGLFGGLLGLLVMGIGLVSVPGLILAAKLFFLGGPLLQGDPEAAEKARAAAQFARLLNVVVLVVVGIAVALQVPDLLRRGLQSGDRLTFLGFTLFVAVYAGVSLVHASMLDRAADHIDAEALRRAERAADALRADAPRTGVRVGTEASATIDDALAPPADAAAARRAR